MNEGNLSVGSFFLDSFIQWLELHESHTTELGWYDSDGFCVDMDVGYFFEGLNAFRKYFDYRLKENKK